MSNQSSHVFNRRCDRSDEKEQQQEAPTETKELSDAELDSVVGGVPGWWDYDDPTTHT